MLDASSPQLPFGGEPRWSLSPQRYTQVLWIYMVIVFGHWVEHLAQIYQIYAMGWMPAKAGGFLGYLFPAINSSEVLHFTYNSLLLAGLTLLLPGMTGRARRSWIMAAAAQSWHWFEHFLLQIQWLTGIYLYGGPKQASVLEYWFPRPELHFVYNLIVFVPMMVALFHFMRQLQGSGARD